MPSLPGLELDAVRVDGGVVVLVAMGGGALLSFSFGKKGGVAEIFEIGVATGEMCELPPFPLLIKREGADVPSF